MGLTLEGDEKERDDRHAGGREKAEDLTIWWERATVVLGRCIVGVLAFNLTAQFH